MHHNRVELVLLLVLFLLFLVLLLTFLCYYPVIALRAVALSDSERQ